MSRVRLIVACIGSGVAGALIGAGVVMWMMGRLGEEYFVGRAETDLAFQMAILGDLDADRIDAARRRLNVSIDGALITLGPSMRKGRRLGAVSASAIAQVREQRRKTGYLPGDPGVAAAVASALESGIASSTTTDK
jgi:hypothetical protein